MASSLRTTAPALRRLTATAAPATARRTLSTTPRRLGGDAHAHGDHYDPPSGWLFGDAPGTKYQEQGWEKIWYWGFFGSIGLAGVAYCYKPDTSIQTWALEEARRRLEAEGILQDKSE